MTFLATPILISWVTLCTVSTAWKWLFKSRATSELNKSRSWDSLRDTTGESRGLLGQSPELDNTVLSFHSSRGRPAALSTTGSVLRTATRVTFCLRRKALFIELHNKSNNTVYYKGAAGSEIHRQSCDFLSCLSCTICNFTSRKKTWRKKIHSNWAVPQECAVIRHTTSTG